MADKKIYTIEINGVKESANAVESLNKQLNELENRIKKLENSSVKVNATSSGGGGSRSTSAMDEEAKLAKQIEQIDAKREAYSKEIYQNYLAAKEVLDETVKDQKQIAASERLQAHNYTNTMAGLKQELADIKTVINTTDLGDEAFGKMAQRANEITTKLKELDATMGQFGRDVGNYDRVGQGLDKIKVNIGGVTREFSSLRQASRALLNAMGALDDNGQKDTEMYKQMERELDRVSKAQLRLNSAMKDAKASSKVMDDLLDNFESFTAIGHLAQSFSTLFGFDSSEMEKQIAKLVALEGALKDIEKIRQQINTKEGIGKWFDKGSKAVDQFVAKLGGAEVRMGKIIGSSKEASIALNSLSSVLKGVGGVAITSALMLLANIIGNLINNLKKWYTAGFEAGDATKLLGSEVQMLETRTKDLLELNVNRYFKGMYTDAEALSNIISTLSDNVTHLIDELRGVDGINFEKFRKGMSINTFDTDTIDEVRLKFKELANEIENIEKTSKNSVLGETITSWFKGINGKKRDLKELGNIILNDFLARTEEAMFKARQEMHDFNYVTDETISEIEQLRDEVEKNTSTNGVLRYIEKFCGVSDSYKNKFDVLTNSIKDLSANLSKVDTEKLRQLEIDSMNESEEKIKKQNKLDRMREIKNVNFNPAYIEAINKKYDKELDENLKAYRKNKKQEIDQKKKLEKDVQREIDEYRIQLMKEGLDKQIAELRNEEKYKRKEIEDSGIRVSDRTNLLTELYNKKELELRRDWGREVFKIYEDLYSDIEQIQRETFDKTIDTNKVNQEVNTNKHKQTAGDNLITPINYDNIEALKDYYDKILDIEQKAFDEEVKIAKERLKQQKKFDEEDEKRRHSGLTDSVNGEYIKQLEQGKITQEQYDKLIEEENKAYAARMFAIDQQYASDSLKVTEDGLDKKRQAYNNYHTSLIADIRKEQDRISRSASEAESKIGGFEIINITKTKKNYEDAIKLQKDAINKIQDEKRRLIQNKNKMNGEDFLIRREELEAAERAATESLKNLEDKSKNVLGRFFESIQQYVQVVGQAFSQIMTSIWNAQDVQFDKEQEELDKMNEELDEKLDEQQDIIEKHKDAIDSIEEELATARGDRRQHLIDQLNAEMAAQRAARAEEKRLQKEKENAEKKQDKLDDKRKRAQYNRDKTQAIVSGALAVVNALATKPFVPTGLAMAALAAATTTAQIAIMSANKPYAKGGQLDGGVAQGKRHRDGGIPVLGGKASIEGGEYITNRVTTSKNVELLDYINSKKKKIDISDLMDFYSTNPRKVIRTVRTKFEDGGYLPTLPNELDIKDQLQNIVVNQDNRPIYVSVVDINNKQDEVRRVQTLAGM